MKNLNKMRLLAGIPIDSKIEITEAREVPRTRHELSPTDERNLAAQEKAVATAISHIEKAIKVLEKAPAIDMMADIPSYINELEEILSTDGGEVGMRHYLTVLEKKGRAYKRKLNAAKREEEELAKADFDKDGKLETPEEEYKGSRDRAIKRNLKEGKEFPKEYREGVKAYRDGVKKEDCPYKQSKGKAGYPYDDWVEGWEDEYYEHKAEKKDLSESQLNEDHYKKGEMVQHNGDEYEVLSSEGDGDDEIYKVKCSKSGETHEFKASELKKVKKAEKVDEMHPMTTMMMKAMHMDPEKVKKHKKEMKAKKEEAKKKKVHMKEGGFENEEQVPFQHGGPRAWTKELTQAIRDEGVDPEQAKVMAVNDYEFEKIYNAPDYPHKPKHLFGNVYRLGESKMFMTHVSTKKDYGFGELPSEQEVKEAMLYYADMFPHSHEADDKDPINVADGKGDKNLWDELGDTKNENPRQERDEWSEKEMASKVPLPDGLKAALKTEAGKAQKESDNLKYRDKKSSKYYGDLAKNLVHLHDMLDGTQEGLKKAQLEFSTWMGPMRWKVPGEVMDYLMNAGKRRSLKDYFKEVKVKDKDGADPTKTSYVK